MMIDLCLEVDSVESSLEGEMMWGSGGDDIEQREN